MFVAIRTRFGGNEATKKTQKALLKQQYENFNASSIESLDSVFNRLQTIVSRLAILDIETMSIDDLYNNFKIVEQDVKKSVGVSTGTQNMAFMTAPSTSNTNNVNTANSAGEVGTGSSNVNTASSSDIKQIHEDDLEAMDLKWQLSLLSMRAKRYYQRTGNKIFINANDTAGYDKSKQGNNEETSSKAMLAIDGVGFEWSDMAEEQVQTNMALMAFSDSEVYNDKTCSKTCLKNYESLKKQFDDLLVKLNETEFKAATYKRGLATVEEQLVTFRKNEVLFSEEVIVLKREVACKDYEIGVLKTEFEKVKQEKEGIDFKIAKFDNASKCLNKLLESQITDKSKKGLGYHVVAPPHPLSLNAPTKLDLYYSGLDEFKEPEFNGYGPRDTVLKSTIDCDNESDNSEENTDDSLVKEQVSEDDNTSVESPIKVNKETVFHVAKKVEFVKSKKNEKPVRKSVRPRVVNTARTYIVLVNTVRANEVNVVKASACWVWRPTIPNGASLGKPQMDDKGFVDSGCSRHMTGNIAYLSDFKEFDRGYVIFGGGAYGGRISEAVSTACYVHNRVLIVKPHNKTPYELIRGFKPALSFMKPFGCHVTILNTLDSLGKFDGKSDEGTSTNESAGTQGDPNAGTFARKPGTSQECIVMLIWKDASHFDSPSKEVDNDDEPKQVEDGPNNESDDKDKSEDDSSPKEVNTARQHVNTASPEVNTGSFKLNTVDPSVNTTSSYDQDSSKDMLGAALTLEATHIEFFSDEDEPKVDLGNISNSYAVPTTPNTRIHTDHPNKNVIGKTHEDLHTRLFACFLSHEEPKRISKALRFEDPNYPNKVYKVVKALYGLHQAPRAWYETLANYLLGNGFHRGKIDQTLFIKKQKGDILLVQIYVDDIIFGSTKKELCTEFKKLMKDKFQMSSMEELTFLLGLQVPQREDGIFISQDKYVDKILRKFNYTDVKSASNLVDLEKPLVKDGYGTDVDEHLYRSMIGSLMYLTGFRPDIMFAVCACDRFQVTPKTLHLLVVKRIFRYLKGKPTLGLWYSRDSPFELVAYTDSDYVGATQDRKSTTGGCQFLGNSLISWQCKKQIVVATSTTEAEYVAIASCYGQVLWIQNQLLDYGYNFMNTMIHIDNNNLLTKGFDAERFQYLVSSIGKINP
ncbi:putative ribonuclease H-like domain-containing protein [Tanacetum coccineum]